MERRSGARLPRRSPSPEPELLQHQTSKAAPAAGTTSAPGHAGPAPLRTSGGGGTQQSSSRQSATNADSQLPSPARRPPSASVPGAVSPRLSQDMDGFDIPELGQPGADGADGVFAGHELYRALRGEQGDDPMADDVLWDGDFLTSQREFIQKQQEEQMLERLERRMGRIRATPKEGQAGTGIEQGPSLATVANIAKTGAKFMGLIGMLKPKGQAASSISERPPSATAIAAAVLSADGTATTRPGVAVPPSPGTAVSGPASPAKVALLDVVTSPTAAAAVAAAATALEPAGLEAEFSKGTSISGSASSPVTPRLLTRLIGSMKASPRLANALGNLVAEEDSKQSTAAAIAAAAVSADGQAPADGVVQIAALKAAKTADANKAKQDEEQLQRLDTASRLEMAAEREQSWVRRTAIKICTHSDFELLVLLLIFGNCISLASYDPVHHESERNKILENLDIALNAAFTIEMILRILSLGGVLQYLSHPWNAFDGVMVLAGYTTFIPMSGASGGGLEGIKALRALRAMRPLRTITRFPALRSIVVCFLEAVPLLVSVAAMLFFFLFIFAVAGTEMFGDSFHWGCMDPATGRKEADSEAVPDEFGCGARSCPTAYPECHLYDNSQSTEIAGFDNVGLSMLSVFQAMTLSNWSFTMYRTMDFLSPVVVIYWFIMIIFGSYFVLNLFLAVLKTKFAKAKSLLDEKRRHRRALKGVNHKKQNFLMRTGGWLKGKVATYVSSKAGSDSLSSHIEAVLSKRAASEQDGLTARTELTGFTDGVAPAGRATSEANVIAAAAGAAWGTASQAGARSGVGALSGAGNKSVGARSGNTGALGAAAAKAVSGPGGGLSTSGGPQSMHSTSGGAHSGAVAGNHAAAAGGASSKPPVDRQLTRSESMGSGYSGYSAYTGVTGVTGTSAFSTGSMSHECLLAIEEFDETVQDMPAYKRYPLMFQYRVRVLVCNSWFNNILLFAIVLNTLALAMTHEGMSPQFEEGLHQANFIFTFLFTAEMILKIIGLGPWRYFTDAWSLFDAAVVAFSLVEVVTELMARSSAGGGMTALRSVRSLRVLRSFRVLRVMRMFKYLESLKMIASVLVSSMGSFASIVVLLVLFWMVFSIMGLHVFGGLPLDTPWPNCDDLVNSLILNFNTLNLENFQTQMYSVIRATSYASTAFWLVWVIVGKYILLTLFLAVTLDAFERKYKVDMKKGVRQQSMASTIFSRIKKVGAKLKGTASGAGSNSGKSGLLGSLWGNQSSRAGSMSAKLSHPGSGGESGVVHDAIASFHGGRDSGQSGYGTASPAVHVSGGSYSQHRHGSADGDHRANRRSSADRDNHGSMNGTHHHSASGTHDRRRSTDRHTVDRRRTGEGVRFAHHSGQPQEGPVGEGIALLEPAVSGWGTGIRQRRHRIGLEQQYGVTLNSNSSNRRVSSDSRWASHEGSGRWVITDEGPGGEAVASGNLQVLRSLQRRQFLSMRRTSSNNFNSGSSQKFRIDAAAAFAAAAASEALQPVHALPEFVSSSSEDEANGARKSSKSWADHAQQKQFNGYNNALAEALEMASLQQDGDSHFRKRLKDSSRASNETSEAPFTWHEFLTTIDAIEHPGRVREQQQAAINASFRAADAAADGPTLGPIAEGVEDDNGSSSRPVCSLPASDYTTAIEGEGAATFSRGIAAAAAAAVGGQTMSPRPPAGPKPANAARSRLPQKLAVDDIENEIASLGLQPQTAEPTTPYLLVHGSSGAAADGSSAHSPAKSPGAAGRPLSGSKLQQEGTKAASSSGNGIWPGLGDEEGTSSDSAQAEAGESSLTARDSSNLQSEKSSGVPRIDSADSRDSSILPPKPRRVTLFTESMRQRQEGPRETHNVRFSSNPPSHTGGASLRASAAVAEVDDILEAVAAADMRQRTVTRLTEDGTLPTVSMAGGFDAASLLEAGMVSVEPSITAKAIKRRKAAAGVSFAPDAAAGTAGLPGGVDDAAAPGTTSTTGRPSDAAGGQSAVPVVAVESSAPSLNGTGSQSGRRISRQMSMGGSEGNYSDGHSSWRSGNHSGNWSTVSRTRAKSHPDLEGVSMYVFTETNPFRVVLYNMVIAKWFDYAMFFVILLNCVAMAYEYPHMSRKSMDGYILYWADVAFTVVFSLESLMKIIAFGFKPYMSFFQNQVDLLIVVTSIIMALLDSVDLEIVKALRVLRAIKPLRALTRSAGMQLIFKSLTLSLAAMGNVSIVVALFFMIFAILGVQLFHGKFYSCNDTSVPDKAACVGTYIVNGVEVPRQWTNAPYNFDNIGMALVSLFVTSTLNGYTDIMAAAMAAPEEPGLQPHHMSNWASFFYFVAFVLVVAYTLLNLYIGVVFYQFSRIRLQSQTGSAFLTDDQTEWVELSRLVFRLKPPEKSPVPVNKFRRKLYYTVQSKKFEFVIMAAIVANSALMATTFYGEPEEMRLVVEAINYTFTGVYVLELLLKVGGLGWTNYWKNNWNKFDFLLVMSSVADMVVTLAIGSHASFLKIQKIMRLLRLARVVKLMRSMKGLRSLFGTLIVSLPAFWNVGALLALLFYMYAYVGMLLLGSIKRNGGLNEHSNFERFWTAALTLFKIATNDNWTDIMIACMIAPPDCDPAAGECGSWVVYPYFVSFVLLVSVIMLNLFTAVILESFEAQQEQDRWKLRPDHLDEFVDLWAEYDDGTGTIDPKDLETMLLRLSPPLGLGPTASSTDVLRFVFDLDIPLLAGRVPFHRTAYELVRRCSGAEIPEGMLKDQIDRLVNRAFKNLKADEVLNFSVAVTVMRVQRKWRARMRAAKLKRKREFRAERGVAPAYGDVLAARDVVMKSTVERRQAGDLRWRPNAAYAQYWGQAESIVAADQAAAAAAARAAQGYRQSNSSSNDSDDNPLWSSIAGLKSTADGWMHRMTGGIHKLNIGKLFTGSNDQVGSKSGFWEFASRASSKVFSAVTSRAASESASRAMSEEASRVTSETASRAASGAVPSMRPSAADAADREGDTPSNDGGSGPQVSSRGGGKAADGGQPGILRTARRE